MVNRSWLSSESTRSGSPRLLACPVPPGSARSSRLHLASASTSTRSFRRSAPSRRRYPPSGQTTILFPGRGNLTPNVPAARVCGADALPTLDEARGTSDSQQGSARPPDPDRAPDHRRGARDAGGRACRPFGAPGAPPDTRVAPPRPWTAQQPVSTRARRARDARRQGRAEAVRAGRREEVQPNLIELPVG